MLMMRSSGLAPVGSGCGVSERDEDWMAVFVGFTCCALIFSFCCIGLWTQNAPRFPRLGFEPFCLWG